MFARQAFRAAQPMKPRLRTYVTDGKPLVPPGEEGSRGFFFVGLVVLGGGVGYWYYLNQKKVNKVAEKIIGTSPSATVAKAFTGGDQGFISLKLESIENINHNTKKFRFALPEAGQVSGLAVASALLTKYKGPEMEKPAIRPYTPVNDEGGKGYLDLLVKKYPNGVMSTHMHDMTPGQRLDFKGPIPKYAWTPNKHEHIALICGGTGVTPMYQVARAIFNNPEDKTKVTLVLANVTEEDILLKKEFEHLENTYPQRFRAFYVLDKPPQSWAGGKGFVSQELLKQVLPEPKSENIKIFVCGPPGMYKAISGAKKSPSDQGELDGSILEKLGYSKDQVYKF